MRCPTCNRKTYYVSASERPGTSGKTSEDRQPGILQAALKNGTCCRCFRKSRGTGKRLQGSGRMFVGNVKREMTDAQVEQCRRDLDNMMADRRARGIPEDGILASTWAHGNGGLYSWEVK